MRKIEFRLKMIKLLNRFNEMMENVKVEFRDVHHGDSLASMSYYLDFILLTPVPGSVQAQEPPTAVPDSVQVQDPPCCVSDFPVPAPSAPFEFVENSNSDVVAAGVVVAPRHQQSQTLVHPGVFPAINTRETTPTNRSENIPIAVATAVDSPSSEYRPAITGAPELGLLRKGEEELRLENASLRSSAGSSASSPLISAEVLELRLQMEVMSQMMRQMMEQSVSQQYQQMSSTTSSKDTTTSKPKS
jgi:hypothetical protein